MSTHLITGYAGKEHITAADQGSFNAAVMGNGEFVLERGEQLRCQVISNNKVRIYDGDAMMQGRHIIIDRNTYEETTHDNGTQGYKRIDLIVLTYEKNAASSVETVKLEVIKGLPSESDPVVPEYTKGDILNSGASKNQMPLYQIPFDGLSIGEPVKLFSTVPTLEGMKIDVDEKVAEKIAEFEEDFAELEAGIEDKISEAGKPLASNAADWAMIGNYGEYSADAKTVGEEFSKVNNSLGGLSFGTDGEGNYGYFGADGSLIPFKSGMKFRISGEFAAKENTFNPTIAFTNNGNKTVTLNKISTTNTIEYIITKDGTSSTIMSALSTKTNTIDISSVTDVSIRITSPSSWQKIDIEVVVE